MAAPSKKKCCLVLIKLDTDGSLFTSVFFNHYVRCAVKKYPISLQEEDDDKEEELHFLVTLFCKYWLMKMPMLKKGKKK